MFAGRMIHSDFKVGFFYRATPTKSKQTFQVVIVKSFHCVKSVCIWSISGQYFLANVENADQKNSKYEQI